MKTLISLDALKSDELDNHELARLASVYAMPAHLREHETSGAQLPRNFPREHHSEEVEGKEVVVADAASHGAARKTKAKLRKRGLHSKFWKPSKGGFTPEGRIAEIDTAIALLELEKKRLNK